MVLDPRYTRKKVRVLVSECGPGLSMRVGAGEDKNGGGAKTFFRGQSTLSRRTSDIRNSKTEHGNSPLQQNNVAPSPNLEQWREPQNQAIAQALSDPSDISLLPFLPVLLSCTFSLPMAARTPQALFTHDDPKESDMIIWIIPRTGRHGRFLLILMSSGLFYIPHPLLPSIIYFQLQLYPIHHVETNFPHYAIMACFHCPLPSSLRPESFQYNWYD